MKPRVMSLVIFTSTVGLLTAPITISFYDSVIGIFFVAMGAGAAGGGGGGGRVDSARVRPRRRAQGSGGGVEAGEASARVDRADETARRRGGGDAQDRLPERRLTARGAECA